MSFYFSSSNSYLFSKFVNDVLLLRLLICLPSLWMKYESLSYSATEKTDSVWGQKLFALKTLFSSTPTPTIPFWSPRTSFAPSLSQTSSNFHSSLSSYALPTLSTKTWLEHPHLKSSTYSDNNGRNPDFWAFPLSLILQFFFYMSFKIAFIKGKWIDALSAIFVFN